MRRAWTDYIAKIRKKGNRGKNTMSHREAMKLASQSWPKEKAKIARRLKRESKQNKQKSVVDTLSQKNQEPCPENV